MGNEKKCHLCRKLLWFALKITGLVFLIKWLKGKMGGKCECCGNEPCTCDENCECREGEPCSCGEEKKDEMM